MGWLNGWNYRIPITIDIGSYTSVNVNNWPAFITFSNNATIGAHASANGYDIRFTGTDGTTLLTHERVRYSKSLEASDGVYWVKIPIVYAFQNPQLYMYYGTSYSPEDVSLPTGVWTEYYNGVWHLEENTPDRPFKDSTRFGNHSTSGNYPPRALSQLGYGAEFDASSNHDITFGTLSLPVDNVTIEVVAQVNDTSTRRTLFGAWNSVNGYVYRLYTDNSARLCFDYNANGTTLTAVCNGESLTPGTDYYLVGSIESFDMTGMTAKAVVNYVAIGQNGSNYGASPGGTGFSLGRQSPADSYDFATALIDEVRISNIIRSDGYHNITYRNLIDFDNSLVFGTEESSIAPSGSKLIIITCSN